MVGGCAEENWGLILRDGEPRCLDDSLPETFNRTAVLTHGLDECPRPDAQSREEAYLWRRGSRAVKCGKNTASRLRDFHPLHDRMLHLVAWP